MESERWGSASGHFTAYGQTCMDYQCTCGFRSIRSHPMLLWWCWCTAQAFLGATCSQPPSDSHPITTSTCPTCPASVTAASHVPELADALAAWMAATGLARVALLGNSFGCQVIADLAARHPERVERAVLQGPTTPPEERSWFWQFVRWRQNQRYNPRSLGPVTYGDYRKCGLRRMYWTFQYQLHDRLEDKLPRVQAPVLVVRGAEDPICNQRWCEEMVRLLPHGQLVVIPEVAHTLVYTAPCELVRVTRPFLDEAR
jgi:pimeloyl-ACP methyl ester carboxylesterase